ncbi:glycosyltransferase [Belnapia sp. T18]|uniref:Glycosyltransferase n=1 Tax=Belnapia arida TaxID=2804533 RepID=A0ABS1UDG0_9PROT|nr:glycosyltransferase [Belnapia arida]MBL6082180.1 glycosyltransferase [Belnapia arida]
MSRSPLLINALKVDEPKRGRWARIALRASTACDATILYATMHDERTEPLSGHFYLRGSAIARLRYETYQVVLFIPDEAVEVRLFALGPQADAMRLGRLTFHSLSRAQASAHLILTSPRQALRRWRQGDWFRSSTARGRIRQFLGVLAFEAQIPRYNYATWLTLFDHWSAEDFSSQSTAPTIAYLVFSDEQASEALEATLQSLEAQWSGPAYAVVAPTTDCTLRHFVEEMTADYIGILQAGEVLPPHATRLAAEQLDYLDYPELAIVDEDKISADGVRHTPMFKPEPNHTMMLSGMLSRGLWLVQRSMLLREAPVSTKWAEVVRLTVWLARQRTGVRFFGRRIPFILTHRRSDTEAAPSTLLAELIEQHLQGGGPRIAPVATWPLTFQMREPRSEERITVIIPSTLRQPHSLSCIRAVLDGTDYPLFDIHVAVMQPRPLDAQQRANSKALERYPNVTVALLEAPHFNFSAANNRVAACTFGEYILLLNDDVVPIRRDWLRWLACFLQDPQTGIVGARLLYPDNRVQHGGVIMGLSGLCDHAHRYLPAAEPGYMFRAIIAQELSAVTAACMLVRRQVYMELGGLDERYPSAFNDVDFALRVGKAGYSVVYAPQAELHHHELQTYGSHYAGERQLYEAEEVQRMQKTWAERCAADPFHNPNFSLTYRSEWNLAFPPRISIDRKWHRSGT